MAALEAGAPSGQWARMPTHGHVQTFCGLAIQGGMSMMYAAWWMDVKSNGEEDELRHPSVVVLMYGKKTSTLTLGWNISRAVSSSAAPHAAPV